MLQIIPNSHCYTDLNMILNYLKNVYEAPEEKLNHLMIGIENTLNQGLNIKRVQTVKQNQRVEEWIDEWLDLFPKGVKSGGKLLRSDKASCIIKMRKFLNNNDYTKERILEVTKAYLEEKAMDNYMYTKCATYLIDKKGEGSELAALCENYEADNEQLPHYITNNNGLV